jgi:hypothetical protein
MLLIAASMFNVVSCSKSSTPTPAPKLSAPAEKPLSNAELLKRYDPSFLIETKTLSALPPHLQSVLGVYATGYARLADVGEPCNPTDVIDDDPGRCFLVGGVSDTSALVAFKIGGYAGPLGVGEATGGRCIDIISTQVPRFVILREFASGDYASERPERTSGS